MAFYSWTDNMQIGIASIDDDHKRLVRLIDGLHEAMAKGHGKAVLGATLDELIHYTKDHFQREEQLMQRAGYHGYEEHKREHDQLVKEVLALRERFQAGNGMLSVQVLGFLRDWLTTHIMRSDKRYEAAMAKLA